MLIMFTQYGLKSAWEFLATPFTYRVVAFLKRAEKEDYYDIGTNFTPVLAEGLTAGAAARNSSAPRHDLPPVPSARRQIAGLVMAPMRRRSPSRMASSEEFVMSRYSRYSKWLCTIGLMGLSGAALADDPKPRPPQEPVGFIAGGVIGAFAAGPIGAVVGAGLGTWLGNRVHRAGEAKKAEAQVAVLESDKSQLQSEKSALAKRKEPAGGNQPSLERQAR